MGIAVDPIRILLVELRPNLLRDVTETFVGRADDLEILGHLDSRDRLTAEVRRQDADLVVLGLADAEFPPECRELLDERPRMKVLGIAGEGRRAFLYEFQPRVVPLGELDHERLLWAVREAAAGR